MIDRSALGAPAERDAEPSATDASVDARRPTAVDDAFAPDLDAFSLPDAPQPPPDAFVIDPDLIAWWPFATDDPTRDVTGRGHTLTNVGVRFDGTVGYFEGGNQLHTPDAADLDEMTTITAWVRPTQLQPTRMGVADRDGTWGIFIRPTGEPQCILQGNAAIAGPPMALDQWTHLACTAEAGITRFYVNGMQVGEAAGTRPFDSASRVQIGQNCCDGADELRGRMSDLRMYRRALASGEVASLAVSPPPP